MKTAMLRAAAVLTFLWLVAGARAGEAHAPRTLEDAMARYLDAEPERASRKNPFAEIVCSELLEAAFIEPGADLAVTSSFQFKMTMDPSEVVGWTPLNAVPDTPELRLRERIRIGCSESFASKPTDYLKPYVEMVNRQAAEKAVSRPRKRLDEAAKGLRRSASEAIEDAAGAFDGGFRHGPSSIDVKAALARAKAGKVMLDDVVGIEDAKVEVAEIVEMIREPERFTRLGADIPRGILLSGPPGTGKTHLARALAAEANVPFLIQEGSAFMGENVGMAEKAIRDKFAEARKSAPCILFIDEIDSIGGKRSSRDDSGSKAYNAALTQLLVEMDGLRASSADGRTPLVIVVGATNRTDLLDPALLRPGRFDRKVVVNHPDAGGREQVLRLYIARKAVPLSDDVNIRAVAAKTTGMSPAELKNVVNEASLQAARARADAVSQAHFLAAIDRATIGHERKQVLMSADEKRQTAIHELGHALVATFAPNSDPVAKLSIVPRDIGAGGVTVTEAEDRHYWTVEQLRSRIAMSMGGRAAEKLFIGSVTTGPSNDLEKAHGLARAMVMQFGMSDKLGPIAFTQSEAGNHLGTPREMSVSPAMQQRIENEVQKILEEEETRAASILEERRELLLALVPQLLDKETVEGAEFRRWIARVEGKAKGRRLVSAK